MSKNRKSGPSCLGSLVLFAVIVLGLKFVYDRRDTELINLTNQDTETTESGGEVSAQASIYDTIYSKLSAYSDEVTFNYDCSDSVFGEFGRVCADHPELFWVNGSASSKKTTRGDDVTVVLTPEPILTVVEILECEDKLEAAVDEILSQIDMSLSEYEKVLSIHDILVTQTEYDVDCAAEIMQNAPYSEVWQSSSAYGCLVNKLAVCSGYSAAFQLLMNEMDIPCMRVSGNDRENGTLHEWNCVSLDGEWYYIDVTWDDPTFDDSSSDFKDAISHEYFLIPSEILLRTHTISEDEDPPECTAEKYFYYKYNARWADTYDFETAEGIILSQINNDIIEIRFANAEEAEIACTKLFYEQEFYDIEEITADEIVYTSSKTGVVRIRMAQ